MGKFRTTGSLVVVALALHSASLQRMELIIWQSVDPIPDTASNTSEQKTEPTKHRRIRWKLWSRISFKRKKKTKRAADCHEWPRPYTIGPALQYVSGIAHGCSVPQSASSLLLQGYSVPQSSSSLVQGCSVPQSSSSLVQDSSSPEKKKKKVEFRETVAGRGTLSYVESSPVPSVPEKIIMCFCSAIRDITEIDTFAGVLASKKNKHRVWVPRPPLTSARVVSLAKLLSLPEPPMRERLKLAVRLASSVLQFHSSGWLQERWGKQDIYLIQGDSSQSSNHNLETPVVNQDLTSEVLTTRDSGETRIIHCNLSLFSLGIVLIELWFWRSVESFQADTPQADAPQAGDPETARFVTAVRLIQRLNEGAGINYGSSVRRCIHGLDHQELRLENNEFKSEVYLKVLQPLEKNLEVFCGKSLEEIFDKQGV